MKFSKILSVALFSTLLFTTSCNDDIENLPSLNYAGGILISNEGSYPHNNASVDFVTADLMAGAKDIYKTANDNNATGDVLQSIAFNGSDAFLVLNNSNKIVIVDRGTFKKKAEISQDIVQPRYVAFANGNTYVTNNNFTSVKKVNIYNSSNTLVSSLSFPNYAENIVEAGGKIIVQTDGTDYDASWNEISTGHTISIVNPSSNTVQTTVTLPDPGIIKDLISYNGSAYVVSTTATDSYIYKINPADGTFTTTNLTGIPAITKLRQDSGKFYFLTASGKVYTTNAATPSIPSAPLFTFAGSAYGFNVINGRIFISDASFTGNSTSYVFNGTTGAQLTTFSSGIGTNGFYLNQ